MNSLLKIASIGFAIQVAGFSVSMPLQTEKLFDVTGSLTYLILIIKSRLMKAKPVLRNDVNSALVVVWALRLGSFLTRRILMDGKDKRFDKVKTVPKRFFFYWMIQGLWCVLTAMPVYILNTKTNDPEEAEYTSARDIFGWSLWAIGFLLQVTADNQKRRFRADPKNKDKFITTGVWAMCQHPNYAGEIAMWFGLFVSSSTQLQGLEFLSVLCPLFNAFLLLKVSGVPLLRRQAEKTWGSNPAWRKYVENTNLIIPNPFA